MPSAEINAPPVHMRLKADCNAMDAGILVPNINDYFTGQAPDLGALELGKLPPHYGPRNDQAVRKHSLHWARW